MPEMGAWMRIKLAISPCRQWLRRLCLLACVWYLSGCGGGGSSGDSPPIVVPEPPPIVDPASPVTNVNGPGHFTDAILLKTLSAAEVASEIELAGKSEPYLKPKYAVKAYRLTYLTLDGYGQEILASALVVVPQKPAGVPSPLLSYQHATIETDLEAPSSLAEPASPELIIASMGYIVQAADYVGYGASKGAEHPYLLSAPSASAVIDLLTAAKYWRQTQGIVDNRQLFLTGYSEGGYVTMAAHRALQGGNSTHRQELVSVMPAAGPFNVLLTLDEAMKLARQQYPVLGFFLSPGFLHLLSDSDRDNVRDFVLKLLLGGESDVTFMPTVLGNYFADNRSAIETQSNVDVWRPEVPVHLFHGRDDTTVSYLNSSHTLRVMQDQGAGALVSLTDCNVKPAGHLECVPPYFEFMLSTFGKVAKDL